MAGVLSFDLSPSWCGYCGGDGEGAPDADAFLLPELGDDFGEMLVRLEDHACALIDQFQPGAVGYESPLLLSHDSLVDLRKIYSLGTEIERICKRRGLPCGEFSAKRAKNFITGDPYAEKSTVANKIELLGIRLPARPCDGRLDAGDAAAGWLLHLAEFDPSAASPWIARLRGSLL